MKVLSNYTMGVFVDVRTCGTYSRDLFLPTFGAYSTKIVLLDFFFNLLDQGCTILVVGYSAPFDFTFFELL